MPALGAAASADGGGDGHGSSARVPPWRGIWAQVAATGGASFCALCHAWDPACVRLGEVYAAPHNDAARSSNVQITLGSLEAAGVPVVLDGRQLFGGPPDDDVMLLQLDLVYFRTRTRSKADAGSTQLAPDTSVAGSVAPALALQQPDAMTLFRGPMLSPPQPQPQPRLPVSLSPSPAGRAGADLASLPGDVDVFERAGQAGDGLDPRPTRADGAGRAAPPDDDDEGWSGQGQGQGQGGTRLQFGGDQFAGSELALVRVGSQGGGQVGAVATVTSHTAHHSGSLEKGGRDTRAGARYGRQGGISGGGGHSDIAPRRLSSSGSAKGSGRSPSRSRSRSPSPLVKGRERERELEHPDSRVPVPSYASLHLPTSPSGSRLSNRYAGS